LIAPFREKLYYIWYSKIQGKSILQAAASGWNRAKAGDFLREKTAFSQTFGDARA